MRIADEDRARHPVRSALARGNGGHGRPALRALRARCADRIGAGTPPRPRLRSQDEGGTRLARARSAGPRIRDPAGWGAFARADRSRPRGPWTRPRRLDMGRHGAEGALDRSPQAGDAHRDGRLRAGLPRGGVHDARCLAARRRGDGRCRGHRPAGCRGGVGRGRADGRRLDAGAYRTARSGRSRRPDQRAPSSWAAWTSWSVFRERAPGKPGSA